MVPRKLIIFLIILLPHGSQKSFAGFFSTTPLVVIAPDNRFLQLQNDGPWTAVGRLDLRRPGTESVINVCTATLVHPKIILTAAHCLWGEPILTRTLHKDWLTFHPNMIGGFSESHRSVIRVWTNISTPEELNEHPLQDWAFLELNQPLESRYHALSIKELSWEQIIQLSPEITLTGYSIDFTGARTAAVDQGCHFTSLNISGEWDHNCDSYYGTSGAPLWTNIHELNSSSTWAVLGIHTRASLSQPNTYQNEAIPSARMVQTFRRIVNNLPR